MDEATERERHAALASPVRRRVLDELERSGPDLTATELAAAVGLHVTTVRFHLDQLEHAGLVSRRSSAGRRRGRPSLRYSATPRPDAVRDQLIRVLAEAVAGSGTATPDAVAAGHRWADLLANRPGEAEDAILSAFADLGFEPEARGGVIRLRACPFREVARDHPEVVCQTHLGLAQRIAARHPAGARVHVGLAPFVEPELCLLTLTRTGTD
ncbi:MAG: helix-turn-helix domain-containing protein [Propionicimonas sp.]|nr:helix-turn-helix domain-containing protein [Propionicimonas sp.]